MVVEAVEVEVVVPVLTDYRKKHRSVKSPALWLPFAKNLTSVRRLHVD